MKPNATCPFCSASSRFHLEVYGDNLYKCCRCKLVFISPHPTQAEMNRRHLSEEHASHSYFILSEEISKDQGLDFHHQVILDLKTKLKPDSKLLDVGAGTGDFLSLAKGTFSISAVEASPYHAEKLREKLSCPVFAGPFEEYQPQEKPDAIVMLDMIEHLADPEGMMKKAHDILAPGGFVFISTVNSSSLFFRLGPLVWWLSKLSNAASYLLKRIFSYQHNWYFNEGVFQNIIKEAGFKIIRHGSVDFPITRLRESAFVIAGLKVLYSAHRILGASTNQFILAQKV